MIVIAAETLSLDDAVAKLSCYPKKTVDRYDRPGPGHPRSLTREELIRTRAVSSRIGKDEADWFLDRATNAPWPSPGADLRQADPGIRGGVYDELAALYEHFDDAAPPGIGIAKISKVLHLKRPAAYPILDRKLTSTYREAAGQAALRWPERGQKRMFWAAIRADLITNTESGALAALWKALESPQFQGLTCVTDLRLLDMLTWR